MQNRFSKTLAVLGIGGLLLTGGVAVAQSGSDHVGSDKMGGMSCCARKSDSMDRTLKTIEEARTSNDPAKMRAALEQVQKPLTEMKSHMRMCDHMMGMADHHAGKQ